MEQFIIILQLLLLGFYRGQHWQTNARLIMIPFLVMYCVYMIRSALSIVWIIIVRFILPDTEKSLSYGTVFYTISNVSVHCSAFYTIIESKSFIETHKAGQRFLWGVYLTAGFSLANIIVDMLYREYTII